jgi:hypothetical protein
MKKLLENFISKGGLMEGDAKKILNNFVEEKVSQKEEEQDFGEFVKSLGLDEETSKDILSSLEKGGMINLVFSTSTDHYYKIPGNDTYVFKYSKNKGKIEVEKREKKWGSKEETLFSIEDSEIEALAKKIINLSKEADENAIITIFQNLCLPFNDGKGYKEKLFLKVFELAGINASYEKGIGVVVPASEDKKIVVVSHMDLIPTFNKGFKEKKVYKLFEKDGKECISGALDNTMTNAVAMIAALNNKNPNVEFVFTEGEETGFWGMKAYMKLKHKKDSFYINMDVTNDNWSNHISLEYDEPNYDICCQINNTMNAGFTKDRVCDDLDIVVDNNGFGFSYCLPTKKTIHSWNNYTLIEKLVPYLNGLVWLITELDLSDMKHNIQCLSIKKALICENLDKFLKKEKKAKKKEKKRTKKSYSYKKEYSYYRNNDYTEIHSYASETLHLNKSSRGQRYFDFGGRLQSEEDIAGISPQGFAEVPPFEYEEYEEYEDLVFQNDIMNLEIVSRDIIDILNHNGVSTNRYIERFVHDHVFAQDQWCIDELAGFIGDLEKAEEIILTLDDNLLLNTIETGSVFKFPAKSDYSL